MDIQESANSIIDAVKDRSGLQSAIEKIRDLAGLSHVCYHAVSVKGLTERSQYGLVTYNSMWVRRYLDESYSNIDPVVQASLRSIIPVDWRLLRWDGPRTRSFLDEARDFDISEKGMTFPIHGLHGERALLSINTRKSEDYWDLFIEERARQFSLIANQIHLKVKSIETSSLDFPEETASLSPRELAVFHWIARGKSFQDVADILKITERTVRAHVASVRTKMNASNVTHAVALAVRYGLVSPF